MSERIGEIARMARRASWTEALEHSSWLMRDYPQHAALRRRARATEPAARCHVRSPAEPDRRPPPRGRMRLDALIALGRHAEASALCDELLQVLRDAPDVKHAEARLLLAREGPVAALDLLEHLPLQDEAYAAAAELKDYLDVLTALTADAHAALDGGQARRAPAPPKTPYTPGARVLTHAAASQLVLAASAACDALALASESPAASLPLLVLLGSALSRGEKYADAVRACDAGLAIVAELGGIDGAPSASHRLPHERLLLRRAGCFLALSQPLLAVADFRSAAALNPQSAAAAAGLQSAWPALQASRASAAAPSLYEILGVDSTASADDLRRAYHRAALRLHPDKTAALDAGARVEAEVRFKEVRAAYATLADAESRAQYDNDDIAARQCAQ